MTEVVITAHAVVRYAERILKMDLSRERQTMPETYIARELEAKGVDISSLENAISPQMEAAIIAMGGTMSVICKDMVLLVEDNVLKTVIPRNKSKKRSKLLCSSRRVRFQNEDQAA